MPIGDMPCIELGDENEPIEPLMGVPTDELDPVIFGPVANPYDPARCGDGT
jgi:hypothetical protein